jgi:hypothetical protein
MQNTMLDQKLRGRLRKDCTLAKLTSA